MLNKLFSQDLLAFVNASLFATFALGMFWEKWLTENGAFTGVLLGMRAACIHHGLSLPQGDLPGIDGGFLGVHLVYASNLAQAFWTAIIGFRVCVFVTIVVSLTTPAPNEEVLTGLVYSLTPRLQVRERGWSRQLETVDVAVLLAAPVLNIWFF